MLWEIFFMYLITDVRFTLNYAYHRIFVNSIKKSSERDVRGRAYGFIETDIESYSINIIHGTMRAIDFFYPIGRSAEAAGRILGRRAMYTRGTYNSEMCRRTK